MKQQHKSLVPPLHNFPALASETKEFQLAVVSPVLRYSDNGCERRLSEREHKEEEKVSARSTFSARQNLINKYLTKFLASLPVFSTLFTPLIEEASNN
jgi:hypothetical protein